MLENKFKVLFEISESISRLILSATDKQEFFDNLCNSLIHFYGIELVWVGKKEKDKVIVIARSLKNKEYTENLNISLKKEDETSKGPTATAILTDTISINPDTTTNTLIKPWREKLLKMGFLSSCSIPFGNEKERYTLNIYSSKKKYFDLFLEPILRSIKENLSIFIEKSEEKEFSYYIFQAVENSYDWVIITDRNGIIEYANRAVEKISGYSKSEILGKTPSIFKSGIYNARFYSNMWNKLLNGKVFKGVIINRKKDGNLFQVHHTIIPVLKNKEVKKFISIAKDITKEVELETEIKKFKYQDLLTGLFNRNGFIKQANSYSQNIKESTLSLSFIVLDIKEFSHINAIYGRETCDLLLKKFANRLRKTFRETDITARFEIDRFALFLPIKEEKELTKIIERILSTFEKPFVIKGKKISIEVVFGINITKSPFKAEEEIQKAELALNMAKRDKIPFKFYNEILGKEVLNRYEKLQLIKEALHKDYFIFFFQPIYTTTDLKISGFETLVRIQHPTKGLIYPKDFISELETSEFLPEFEEMLIKKAQKYQQDFSKFLNLHLSINISSRAIKEQYILNLIKDIDSPLIFEITERIFAGDNRYIIETFKKIKDKGFKIEIDDFGTGYSSLSYIDKLPIDAIKIDMSFIKKIETSKKTKAIVKTTIDLAKGLLLETVAEGVENKNQLNILKDMGCDFVQGFYLSKPMNFKEALNLLK